MSDLFVLKVSYVHWSRIGTLILLYYLLYVYVIFWSSLFFFPPFYVG